MPEVRLIDNTAIMEQLRTIEQNSKLTDAQKFRSAWFVVENAPTIEAEPVRHGRWIMLEPYGAHHTHRRKCSECGEIKAKELTNFCPNCGTRMDGGANNDSK